MDKIDEINESMVRIAEGLRILNEKTDRLWDEIRSRNVTPDRLSAMNNTDLAQHYGQSRQTIIRWKKSGKLDPHNRLVK